MEKKQDRKIEKSSGIFLDKSWENRPNGKQLKIQSKVQIDSIWV